MVCLRFDKFPILLLCTLLLGAAPANAQVFWSENFNDEGIATANWNFGGTNAGPAIWTWTDLPEAGYQDPDLPAFAAPTASDGYFYFDSDNNGQTPHDVWLTNFGAPIDCSGKTDVRLRFYTQYIYFNPAGTVAQVGVSTDGVNFEFRTLFNGLQANFPYHDWVEVDLDEADGQAEVYLRFRWIGNYEYHWKIDDLELFEPQEVPCSEAQAGAFTLVNDGLVCQGTDLQEVVNITPGGFVLPTTGPQAGLAWCLSAEPLPANTWPGAVPGVVSTTFALAVQPPDWLNDGSVADYGAYYLTPVVLGGGTLIDTAGQATVENIDPAGGCFILGPSLPIVLFPVLEPLSFQATINHDVTPPGSTGAISLSPGGGSGAYLNDPGLYRFVWNTGATSASIFNLIHGVYSVTVADASGCVPDFTDSISVPLSVGTSLPARMAQWTLAPNPAKDFTRIDLELAQAAPVQLSLRNLFGQPVREWDAGPVSSLSQQLDLSGLPSGWYWLQLSAGAERVQSPLVIQR